MNVSRPSVNSHLYNYNNQTSSVIGDSKSVTAVIPSTNPDSVLGYERIIQVDNQVITIKSDAYISDGDIDAIKKVIKKTKQEFYKIFGSLASMLKTTKPIELRIYSSGELFKRFAHSGQNIFGTYSADYYNSVLSIKRKDSAQYSYNTVLAHEYAHFLEHRGLETNHMASPQWWHEGLPTFITDPSYHMMSGFGEQRKSLREAFNVSYEQAYTIGTRLHLFLNSTQELRSCYLKIAKILKNHGGNSPEYKNFIDFLARKYEPVYQEWCRNIFSISRPSIANPINNRSDRYILRKDNVEFMTVKNMAERACKIAEKMKASSGKDNLINVPVDIANYMIKNKILISGYTIEQYISYFNHSRLHLVILKSLIRNNVNGLNINSPYLRKIIAHMDRYNIMIDGIKCSNYLRLLQNGSKIITRAHMEYISSFLERADALSLNHFMPIVYKLQTVAGKIRFKQKIAQQKLVGNYFNPILALLNNR